MSLTSTSASKKVALHRWLSVDLTGKKLVIFDYSSNIICMP